MQAAIERVLKDVNAVGKCPGILALTPADEEKYAAFGALFRHCYHRSITKALKDAAHGGKATLTY